MTPNLPENSNETQRPIKAIPGFVIGITTTCFALGLLIVNLRLAKFGIYSPEFIRTEYILAGALFLFLTVTTYVSFEYSLKEFKLVISNWKEKHYARAISFVFFGAVSFTAPLMVIFGSLFNIPKYLWSWEAWVSLISLILIGHIALQLYAEANQLLMITLSTRTENSTEQINKSNRLLGQAAFLLFFIGTYSNFMYPHIPPAYGGGDKPPVMLIPTAHGLDVCKMLSLPILPNQSIVGPIEVLTESEKELVVLIPDGLTDKKHAIRLKRELFDAVQAITATN